jgi:tRNA A-37 threonylcarbamoyl transferase component Bud32/tetratricopeptide (TPR) repeat protein
MQAADDIALEYARLRVRLGLVPASERPSIDGRYRVEQTLGRGAMGVVYRVWDERLRRRVALKVVRPALGIAPELLHARLEREAQALAKVDHPNVVHIHDVGSHHGATYLTMQYVPGTTLRRWQEVDGRTLRERLDMYLQAARGLAAAHEGGIVHRDFKPDNVLVGDDGIVRVADFGIAAALALDELHDTLDSAAAASQQATRDRSETATNERLTGTGTILGTPPYMAPEQLAGGRATAQSDQFGFCVALWEAITGERPFTGLTPAQLLDATRRPPRARARELPSWLRPILLRGVAGDPRERFTDMNQLVVAIERARGRVRRIGGGAVLGLGLVAAAALGWWIAPAEPIERERCDAFSEQIDAVWTHARKAELATLATLDPAATQHAITTLDQLAADWRASAVSTCDLDLAPAPDSRQRLCHEAWLVALERSVELIVARSSTQTLANLPDLLARLVPPQGNYCALEPDPRLDPEVARTAAAAREAAEFGDLSRARQLADAAVARALALDPSPYSVERAEALAARGEVHVMAGEIELALVSLADAQAQAIASGHRGAMLDIALWRAHAAVMPGREPQPELAASWLEPAEPIAHALQLDPADPRRGDLESTRALIEQARGELELALGHHRRAQTIYTAAGRPIRVARSLINIGTIHHQQGDIDQAQVAYRQAGAVLAEAGVPERHRFSLALDYHLGLIAYQSSDAAGLVVFDRVARLHADPQTRLRALGYGIALALDVGSAEVAREWAITGLAELDRYPDPPADLAIEIESSAALVLASAGDPTGEVRLDAAEARAAALDEETHVNLRCTRIDWLEEQGRCPEALRRLAALDAFVEPLDPEFRARVYAAWRAGKPSAECPID